MLTVSIFIFVHVRFLRDNANYLFDRALLDTLTGTKLINSKPHIEYHTCFGHRRHATSAILDLTTKMIETGRRDAHASILLTDTLTQP